MNLVLIALTLIAAAINLIGAPWWLSMLILWTVMALLTIRSSRERKHYEAMAKGKAGANDHMDMQRRFGP
jgi:hypothetical protein